MALATGLLARGPWSPERLRTSWRRDAYRAGPEAGAAADAAIAALRERGSPSHDGMAARLVSFEQGADGLELELQPVRWALRLVEDAAASLSALCVVRDVDGRWLAGRRAAWLATWTGRWTLGAGGAVEVGEDPAATLTRELEEEWSVAPERLRIEALVGLPRQMAMLIGQAWLPHGAEPVPDAEHDRFAWWPPDPADWPAEADGQVRTLGALLASA